MKQLALILLLAFAVSSCASSRAADPPQSKPKPVSVTKAKAGAAPVSIAPPAAPAAKPQAKTAKTWKWYAPWRPKASQSDTKR